MFLWYTQYFWFMIRRSYKSLERRLFTSERALGSFFFFSLFVFALQPGWWCDFNEIEIRTRRDFDQLQFFVMESTVSSFSLSPSSGRSEFLLVFFFFFNISFDFFSFLLISLHISWFFRQFFKQFSGLVLKQWPLNNVEFIYKAASRQVNKKHNQKMHFKWLLSSRFKRSFVLFFQYLYFWFLCSPIFLYAFFVVIFCSFFFSRSLCLPFLAHFFLHCKLVLVFFVRCRCCCCVQFLSNYCLFHWFFMINK